MDDKNILRLIPYFSTLSPVELEAVYPLCSVRKIARGDMVIHAGEASASLFIVVSGAIKVFITSLEGREQVVNVVYPGQAVNDMAFFDRETNAIGIEPPPWDEKYCCVSNGISDLELTADRASVRCRLKVQQTIS